MSLLPSATEIVYALGLGDDLVGVTFECDGPPTVRSDKEIVVGGRDTSGMSPADINRYVHDQLANGEDLYTLHADALARLHPDLLLTQDPCRVCALPSGHVTEALDYLGCSADVLSLDPYTLDEVLDTILAVGAMSQSAVVTAALPGIPVWAIDADSLVVRPRPRLVAGAEAIAAILHPDAVPAPPAGTIALIPASP